MALFKINRGDESNLPKVLTNGWAYFCTNGNFYIDYTDSEGIPCRKQINADAANKLHFTENGMVVDIPAEVIDDVVNNAILYRNDPILIDNTLIPSAVCYGNGMVVSAGGNGTYAAYSTDNVNWIKTGETTDYFTWSSICYGDGVYVACNTTEIRYSQDGKNWISVSYPSEVTSRLSCSIAFGDGKFVIIVKGRETQNSTNVSVCTSIISTNGIDWTVGGSLPSGVKYNNVCYGNNRFFAIGASDSWESYVAYSEDGVTWTQVKMFETEPNQYPEWASICYSNGRFTAIDIYDYAWSDDGINWNYGEISGIGSTVKKIVYGNDMFVAITSSGNQYLYSADGTDWVVGRTIENAGGYNCLWFDGSSFFNIENHYSYSCTTQSSDGINWEFCSLIALKDSSGADITEELKKLLVGDIIVAIDNL